MGERMCCWFPLVLLLLFLQVSVLYSQEQRCGSADLKALEGFILSLGSDVVIQGWDFNSSSSSSSVNCCIWPGITCDSSSSDAVNSFSRIVGLNLTSMGLNGTISDSLAELGNLTTLNLSNNFLSGGVPPGLFRLPKLETLDLSLNRLFGEVPQDSNLPSIRTFNISFNSFNGTHPILKGSALLTKFDISGNYFNGTIDTSICNSSPVLLELHLSGNKLSGDFPAGFGNCRLLKVLKLDANYISGGFPADLFGLSSLTDFCVQDNLLEGMVDPRFSNLSNLQYLDLSSNKFSGSIPSTFGNLTKLEFFSASSCKLDGTLPSSLSKLSAMRVLNLRNNSFTGVINLNFVALWRLISVDLGSNQLTGLIPEELSSCKELKTLNLARNKLHGQIPESFQSLTQLSYLSLSINFFSNLSSALGVLQEIPNLSSLVLTRNFIGETLPVDGIHGFRNLSLFVVANCGLTGPIPEWLSRCSNLQLVDLSWNHLDGTIPFWFGKFESMFYLDLSNNSLCGEIPMSLTTMTGLLSNASKLGISPANFPFFTKKNDTVKGFQYNQINSFPPSLVLSHNKLTGSISPEFGNLVKLHVFDLSMNNLTGTIPEELSKMSSLEILDLSHNNLTGSIPLSLTKLSFLSMFSVASNNLSGPIPTGGQFSTFTDSSYTGNPDLCGHPLSSCQSQTNVTSQSDVLRRKGKGIVIGMALGIGCGSAFILALLYLVVTRAHSGKIEVTETVSEEDSDELLQFWGPESVVLFQNKDGKEITVDDILKATNNFDQANIIGCGGFGLVYKATLPDGQNVAIKRLSGDFGQMDKEFHAEIQTLSRAQHSNLVMLQGFGRIGSVRILIYTYMENGSLDFWLHEKQDGGATLDWSIRLKIAQGAAKGLGYLHLSCQPQIIHRDIKSSNILLDEKFTAHLADFGLARLIRPYDTHVTTDLVGTLGYIPPEYGQVSVATFKGDIYSFGVVLLELLTGRRPVDMCQPRGQRELFSWVVQMKNLNRVTEVFDQIIYSKQNEKQLILVLEIACCCLRENPKDRPLIQQIMSWLDEVESVK